MYLEFYFDLQTEVKRVSARKSRQYAQASLSQSWASGRKAILIAPDGRM